MLQKLTSATLLFVSAILLFFAVTGNHGLLHLEQLNNELSTSKQNNLELESDIAELNNEIYAIENSPDKLEQVAREDLGLARNNEIIYVVRDKDQ